MADNLNDVNEPALAALRKANAACVDFEEFGSGKAFVRIKEYEYPPFRKAIKAFQDRLDDITPEEGA